MESPQTPALRRVFITLEAFLIGHVLAKLAHRGGFQQFPCGKRSISGPAIVRNFSSARRPTQVVHCRSNKVRGRPIRYVFHLLIHEIKANVQSITGEFTGWFFPPPPPGVSTVEA